MLKTLEELEAEERAHFTKTGRRRQRAHMVFMREGRGKKAVDLYARAHPLTCGGDRGNEAHRAYAETVGLDWGELEFFEDGSFRCPVCEYVERAPGAIALAGSLGRAATKQEETPPA